MADADAGPPPADADDPLAAAMAKCAPEKEGTGAAYTAAPATRKAGNAKTEYGVTIDRNSKSAKQIKAKQAKERDNPQPKSGFCVVS